MRKQLRYVRMLSALEECGRPIRDRDSRIRIRNSGSLLRHADAAARPGGLREGRQVLCSDVAYMNISNVTRGADGDSRYADVNIERGETPAVSGPPSGSILPRR